MPNTIKQRIFKIFLKYAVKLLTPRKLRKKLRKWQCRFFKATQILKEVLDMNNALIMYFSETGNTEKVALAIKRGLEKEGLKVTIKKVDEARQEELYDYDLVCFGSPILHSLPPPPIFKFIKNNEDKYRNAGEVTISSPKVINKNALIFFALIQALTVG